MLKVGLIGCGGMGSNHAACYSALSSTVKLVAAADLSSEKAKKAADKFGGRIYRTGKELIENEELDIVDICLPTYLHTEHAVLAMKKGMHVFLEKPVCLNMDEAELLLKTQKETGVKVQIGQVIRFWDEYVWLRNALKEGRYGKLISASFFRLSPNPKWGWENWYNRPELSGTMATDLHVHDTDFIRYLMEREPDSVSSRAAYDADGILEQIFTTYQFGDAVITAEGCWDFPDNYPFRMTYRAKLEKATVDFDGNTLTVYPTEGGKFNPEISKEYEQDEDVGINISSLGAYYNEIKHFTECVANDKPILIAPLSEAVKSLALVLKEIELAGGKTKQRG